MAQTSGEEPLEQVMLPETKAAFDEELSFYDAYTKNADLVDSELAKNANVKAILV